MQESDKYASQKNHLSKQKQLRVWVNPDKYEAFKQKVEANGTSIYSLINTWIDQYLYESES